MGRWFSKRKPTSVRLVTITAVKNSEGNIEIDVNFPDGTSNSQMGDRTELVCKALAQSLGLELIQ